LINKISIFGLGYVGLTTATCFATKANVIGFDIDTQKIEGIKTAKTTFYEPSLDDLLIQVAASGRLKTTTNYFDAILASDVTFICVDTPTNSNGYSNLNYVENATTMISNAIEQKDSWHLVVVKSTVPPGTTSNLVRSILERNSKHLGDDFGLCMNPEFLREGSAVNDTFNPDRIIIGEIDNKSGDYLESMLKEFYGELAPPILRTSAENAELIKYTSNAFLATKISFANMIANLCEKIPGADITTVVKGIGYDKRIGSHFLSAGAGWGGSCFPKDTRALVETSKRLDCELSLIIEAIKINEERPKRLVEMAENIIGDLDGKRISLLGLSFKPKTDDVRNAPSLRIIELLLKKGATIVVYDPVAINNVARIFGNKINYSQSSTECLKDSDCCILVTEWDEFKHIKPETFLELMNNPALIDGRRIYNPEEYSEKIFFKAVGMSESKKVMK
jgi:UDPglucose 6-dehydrogenase